VVVLVLSWFLEKKGERAGRLATALQMGGLAGIPFLLILKQPDLGTALVLYPIALVMGYMGVIHKGALRWMASFGLAVLVVVSLLFVGFLDHEKMRPVFTLFLKEYQYERLNPATYHQKAASVAI